MAEIKVLVDNRNSRLVEFTLPVEVEHNRASILMDFLNGLHRQDEVKRIDHFV